MICSFADNSLWSTGGLQPQQHTQVCSVLCHETQILTGELPGHSDYCCHQQLATQMTSNADDEPCKDTNIDTDALSGDVEMWKTQMLTGEVPSPAACIATAAAIND